MSLGRGGNGNEQAKQVAVEASVTLNVRSWIRTLPKLLVHSFAREIGGDNSGQGEYS